MKIRLVGAKLFHADGETNTTKLTVAFCNFANMPIKSTRFATRSSLVLRRSRCPGHNFQRFFNRGSTLHDRTQNERAKVVVVVVVVVVVIIIIIIIIIIMSLVYENCTKM